MFPPEFYLDRPEYDYLWPKWAGVADLERAERISRDAYDPWQNLEHDEEEGQNSVNDSLQTTD